MTLSEQLLLGTNTAIIGMGIVFLVLIILSIIITIQSKLVAAFFPGIAETNQSNEVVCLTETAKTGVTSGETVISGVEDDETVALIMAIVSNHANIPLNDLKIKSIKAV